LKKRKIHPLEYLAQFFDCCEINTSFYGHIRPNVGKSRREKTAAVRREEMQVPKRCQQVSERVPADGHGTVLPKSSGCASNSQLPVQAPNLVSCHSCSRI
jgi:hypothetical protein